MGLHFRNGAVSRKCSQTNEPSKAQVALDYVCRRCDADDECCVFRVHADNEATTFISEYKTIEKKLGVDERPGGPDLLDAVRSGIEAQRKWLLILDSADHLKIFGVGHQAKGRRDEGEPKPTETYPLPVARDGTMRRVEMRKSLARLSDRVKVLRCDLW